LHLERENWQAVTVLTAIERRERSTSKGNFADEFSQTEEQHECHTRIKSGVVHLHRQKDTQDFVCTKRQALSPWAVAPPVFADQIGEDNHRSTRGMYRWAKRYRKDVGAEVLVREAQTGYTQNPGCATYLRTQAMRNRMQEGQL
jgi:hypothetical protein